MSQPYGSNAAYGSPESYRPRKNWLVAVLLSVFLGGFGIDRFYLGHIGLGIAKLLLSWATFGIWWLLDLIFICIRNVDSSKFDWDDQVPR